MASATVALERAYWQRQRHRMKPGERIRLITECADRLLSRQWSDAQLTMAEFGLHTYEPGPGYDFETRDYFVHQVRDGGNENLTELHRYLLGDDAAPSMQHELDHPWGTQPVRVFMSHKYDDRVFIAAVKTLLHEYYGIDAFVAHDNIDPSKKWRDVIRAGLATADMLVAVLHPNFHDSQWCDQEVGWALGRDIPVAAVRRQGEPRGKDGFLEEHQDITLGTTHGGGEWFLARQIFQIALNDSRTHEKGLRALAEAFVHSYNFDNTRALWSLIEKEPRWESDQLRRFEYAVETNRQVYEANVAGAGMPELVKQLVEKFEPRMQVAPQDPWSTSDEPPF